MQWMIENWLLLLVGGGMLAMHLFGHGHGHKRGHKGDGGNAHHKASNDTEPSDHEPSDQKATNPSKEDTNV